MTTTQIWQHVASGDLYAVELTNAWVIVGAVGPLTSAEADTIMAGAGFDSDPQLVADLNNDSGDYVQA